MQSVLAIKSCKNWLVMSIFFGIFSLIYEMCSFGVISLNMVLLFMYPLLLGFIPCALLRKDMGRFYNDGVLLLSFASLLNGVFDIYGTSSIYPKFMIALGIFLLLVQVLLNYLKKAQNYD